jgi:hypothetical protein
MTADEYRAEVVSKMRACRSTFAAEDILSSAANDINSSSLSRHQKVAFWGKLSQDLNEEAQKAEGVVEKQGVQSFSQVVAAAQAVIVQHQQRVTSEK